MKLDEDGVDELGPVNCVVVEFSADKANFSGEMAAELSAFVERGWSACPTG
jgi:hypothetical protein